jgi:hypothetical protein
MKKSWSNQNIRHYIQMKLWHACKWQILLVKVRNKEKTPISKIPVQLTQPLFMTFVTEHILDREAEMKWDWLTGLKPKQMHWL